MGNYRNPILICDDDVRLTQLLAEFLQEYGYVPLVVHRGDEVLPNLRSKPVDIVLLDVSLPDVNGLDVIGRIKHAEKELGRLVRVIVLTGHHDARLALDAITRGAYYFFTKPVVFKSVIEQIEIAVGEIESERVKLDQARQGGATPGDALDQMLAAKESPNLSAVRTPFNRLKILQAAPEGPGVLTLRDKDGKAIHCEWAENIARRLTYYSALSAAASEQCRYAASFEYFLTEDQNLAGTIFDKLVNELGTFPRCMKVGPAASKYEGKEASAVASADDRAVTHMIRATETKALEDVKRMLAASPGDMNLKDWYAFLCYSHNQLHEAVALYDEMLQAGSTKLEHHFYLANATYKLGDVKRAIEHWQIVMKKAPTKNLGRKSALRIKSALEASKAGPAGAAPAALTDD